MTEAVNVDISMLPEVTNPSFYPLLLCKDRYLVMYGGAGSGKSYFAVEKILVRILKAMAKGKVHKFLCLRKTQPSARKSIFSLFQEYITNWGLKSSVNINKTDMTITFLGGSQIIITGIDDPEKIKSIHGITGVWLEEATELTYDDFTQIDLRVRGITWDYKQIILTFNPIDEQHWIRQRLFDDDLQNEIESGSQVVRKEWTVEVEGEEITYGMSVMHSTYNDNKFIDKVYKAKLLNLIEQDANYHKIYTLGVWGILEGLIFEQWEVCKKWPESFDVMGFGLDFGFAVDPSAIVEAGFIGDDLYLRERLYETKLTNRDITQRLKGITQDAQTNLTVADSAEPKSIVEIRQAGHPCIPAVKGKDSIVYGIQRVKQFKVHLDYNSPNLVKEFQGYKWAEDKQGNPLNKPVDFNNHLIDATRYIVQRLKGLMPSLDCSGGEGGDSIKTHMQSTEQGVGGSDGAGWSADIESDDIWEDI